VNNLTHILEEIVTDPPALFRRAADDDDSHNITTTPVKVMNDGTANITSPELSLLYNISTSCVIGPSINVGDTIILKIEITGFVTSLLSLSTQLRYCDGTTIPFQGTHSDFSFSSSTLVTYVTDFSFTYSEEMSNQGGVGVWAESTTIGGTFLINQTNFLIFRYRPTLLPTSL
jgi:hypothetical protein